MALGSWFRRRFHLTFAPEGAELRWAGRKAVRLPLASNPQGVLTELIPQGPAWAALEELWTEGFVHELAPNRWRLDYAAFEKLGEDDVPVLGALGLPTPGPSRMSCQARGNVTEPGFRIVVELHHPSHGILRDGETRRHGSVFLLGSNEAVPLTASQRRVFDEAGRRPGDAVEDRMGYLARVREAALEAGADLDPYLAQEEYAFADRARIGIREESPEEITLIPEVDGIEEFDSQGGRRLLDGPPPKVLTRVTGAGGRRRMVLGENVRAAIQRLPPEGRVCGADVPRLLTNPEQIVPEGFDLSLFSERVKGLKTRVYNSRPYLHVRRSTGGWFEGVPGIDVEDWSPGDVDDGGEEAHPPPDLSPETYRELVRRARETGEEFQPFEGGWIRIDPTQGEKFDEVMEELEPAEGGVCRIPAGSVLEIYENLDLLEFVDPRTLERLEGAPGVEDVPPLDPPADFRGSLYPHQLVGYRWLSRLAERRLGGLLADDMGLGKTAQVIGHVLRLKEAGESGPHLVVVPKTLVENWEREIHRFSGGALAVARHRGAGRDFSRDMYVRADVVLTTYDTLRRDQARLGTIDWNLVACDEAQYVKNPTAQRTSALKALKSKHRVALTGTPVENGLIEFWCIMDFVQPGLLGSWRDFRANYERPIVEGEEEEREEKVRRLLDELRGHYLRRLKEDILKDLPPKHTHYRPAPLGEEQLELYKAIARHGRTGGRGAALGAITQLIRLCAHPGAVAPSRFSGEGASSAHCPKLATTLEVLDSIRAKGEKAIVFTDFKAVQRILRDAVRQRFGLWPDIVNGELTGNRQAVIDVFSERPGFNVLILGHQVAGVGLNITAASHVIHYTRPWNPAKENQATDRAHRIGQTRPVHVYYPIVEDERFVTVEKRLDEVIASKSGLARDVLRPSSELRVREEDLLACLDEVE